MAYEQRDNSGTVFNNDKKQSEKHPDVKGDAMIGGVAYWVSGWRKTSSKGTKFLSLSFTPKDETAQSRGRGKPSYQEAPEDEAPF